MTEIAQYRRSPQAARRRRRRRRTMYPARITAVSLFAIGIVTLVAAALPDQAEAPETAIPVPVYSLAPSATVQVLEQAEEVVAVSEEITPPLFR